MTSAAERRKFFLLLIGFTLPFILAGAVFDMRILPGVPLSAAMFVAPFLAVAAVFGENAESRTAAFRNLFRFRTGRGFGVRTLSFVLMPAILLLSFLFARLSGALEEDLVIRAPRLLILLVAFIVSAIGEESGWTGFLLLDYEDSRRYRHYLSVPACYVAWHLIPFIQTGHAASWIVGQCLFSFVSRIMMIQLYALSGRAGAVSLILHATYNLAWQLYPVDGSRYDPWSVFTLSLSVAVLLELAIAKKIAPSRRSEARA